jgi:hypothetical protein
MQTPAEIYGAVQIASRLVLALSTVLPTQVHHPNPAVYPLRFTALENQRTKGIVYVTNQGAAVIAAPQKQKTRLVAFAGKCGPLPVNRSVPARWGPDGILRILWLGANGKDYECPMKVQDALEDVNPPKHN